MDKLDAMRYFLRVAETGSFSAVGREFGVGQPIVSRYIASLEQAMGTQLLQRSTRKTSVTPEGQRYYEQARIALDLITQAETAARGRQNPQGLLRVTCSPALGIEQIIGSMPAFLARYPDLQVELLLSDAYANLVSDGLDLAIRGGILNDSALRARRIGTSERLYVASPAYLGKRGVPNIPAELSMHECVLYHYMAHGDAWPFVGGEVHVHGRMRINSLEGIKRAVLAGVGVGYLPSWMVFDQIKYGDLRVVLSAYTRPPTPIQAVYSAHRLLPQRTLVFIDHIAALFAATPGLDGSTVMGAGAAAPPEADRRP